MTVLTILGSIAAIVVAVITIWNTNTASRQRQRIQHAFEARRARRRLEQQVEHYRTQSALVELERRFDELHAAYSARSVPHDLAQLWSRVFVLSRESPLGTPFKYGALELHRNAGAMTVRNDCAQGTIFDHRLRPVGSVPHPAGAPVRREARAGADSGHQRMIRRAAQGAAAPLELAAADAGAVGAVGAVVTA